MGVVVVADSGIPRWPLHAALAGHVVEDSHTLVLVLVRWVVFIGLLDQVVALEVRAQQIEAVHVEAEVVVDLA